MKVFIQHTHQLVTLTQKFNPNPISQPQGTRPLQGFPPHLFLPSRFTWFSAFHKYPAYLFSLSFVLNRRLRVAKVALSGNECCLLFVILGETLHELPDAHVHGHHDNLWKSSVNGLRISGEQSARTALPNAMNYCEYWDFQQRE